MVRIIRASADGRSLAATMATRPHGRTASSAGAARLSLRHGAKATSVSVLGELDVANLDAVEAWLQTEVSPGVGLVLDVRGLDFLALAGVPVLARMTEGRPGAALLVAPGSIVARVVSLARLSEVLSVFEIEL